MAETYIGVVDRLEGDLAVILLEFDGEVVDELSIDTGVLPEEGRQRDAVLQIELRNGNVIRITYDQDKSKRRHQNVREHFNSLSKRSPSPDNDLN